MEEEQDKKKKKIRLPSFPNKKGAPLENTPVQETVSQEETFSKEAASKEATPTEGKDKPIHSNIKLPEGLPSSLTKRLQRLRLPAFLTPLRLLLGVGAIVILLVVISLARRFLFSGSSGLGKYTYSEEVTTLADTTGSGIGSVEVSTMDLPVGITPLHAIYTPTGRVLVDYMKGKNHCLCTMEDNGGGMIELYVGKIEEPYTLKIFPDNQHILLGESILSCQPGETIDDCEEHSLFMEPLTFPGEIVNSSIVTEKWTDIIISPDEEHIAWNFMRKDVGLTTALGILTQTDRGYSIEGAQLISTLVPYAYEDADEEYLTPFPIRNGELCQFVQGGRGISMAGYATNGMPDAMILDIASGEMKSLTNHPSYDGETMLSPSEVYGIAMSTRFSPTSNLESLAYIPRPRGDVLLSCMDQIKGYSIDGVYARERKGSVGPVLFMVKPSMEEGFQQGINLADTTDTNWIYHGDLSWNEDSTKAMWLERRKDGAGSGVRIRIAHLLDAKPAGAVKTRETPRAGDYADQEPGPWEWAGIIQGPAGGQITLTRTGGSLLERSTITLQYENYTEDGELFLNGLEIAMISGNSTIYTASLSAPDTRGEALGSCDVRVAFTAEKYPHIDTTHIYGSSTWDRHTIDLTSLAK